MLSARLSLPISPSLRPTDCSHRLPDKRVSGAPPWPLRDRRCVTETVVPNQTQVEIGLWSRINSELASRLVVRRAAQLCRSERDHERSLEMGQRGIHGFNGNI